MNHLNFRPDEPIYVDPNAKNQTISRHEYDRKRNTMRVAVVGGTGFVGEYLVDAQIAADHTPILLVRPGNESKVQRAWPRREGCHDTRQPALE